MPLVADGCQREREERRMLAETLDQGEEEEVEEEEAACCDRLSCASCTSSQVPFEFPKDAVKEVCVQCMLAARC